jgi:hypothetical protein
MCELVESALALSVVNADGTGHRYLIPPRSLQQYEDIDWYRPVPGGAMKILFRRSRQPNGARFLINPDGTGLTPFWHRLDFEAFLSPTGAEFVREHPDPVSHFPVLYVGLVDDLTDVSLRQLTHYEPQASEVFTETQGDRHASEAGLSVDSVR